MNVKKLTQLLAATTIALTMAACGHSAGGAHAQASSAHSILAQATANPSVQGALMRAKRDVVNPCIDASTGPTSFENCVYAKVPRDKQAQVKKCMVKAALADHLGTEAGKEKWVDVDVPACVSVVLP